MENEKLVVVLFVIVLLFACVVGAVLYWYKNQQPQQEIMGVDERGGRSQSGNEGEGSNRGSPGRGDKPLLGFDGNSNTGAGGAYYDDGASNSPRVNGGLGAASGSMRGSKRMDPSSSVSNLRDSRTFSNSNKRPSSTTPYQPPKRRSPPTVSPDGAPVSPHLASSTYHNTGGNPLANKDKDRL